MRRTPSANNDRPYADSRAGDSRVLQRATGAWTGLTSASTGWYDGSRTYSRREHGERSSMATVRVVSLGMFWQVQCQDRYRNFRYKSGAQGFAQMLESAPAILLPTMLTRKVGQTMTKCAYAESLQASLESAYEFDNQEPTVPHLTVSPNEAAELLLRAYWEIEEHHREEVIA